MLRFDSSIWSQLSTPMWPKTDCFPRPESSVSRRSQAVHKIKNPTNVCRRLVLLLDTSASMSSQAAQVIDGINTTIRQQRAVNPNENSAIHFSVVKFNDRVSSPTDSTLDRVAMMTTRDYQPSGSTALYDAIGFTIQRYQDESSVVFLVMTDGQENCSRHFTHSQVTDNIKRMISQKGWNFVYLSEDIDTYQQGRNVGIDSMSYNCNNIMVGRNNIGNTLAGTSCQTAISKMMNGEKNVKFA